MKETKDEFKETNKKVWKGVWNDLSKHKKVQQTLENNNNLKVLKKKLLKSIN